MQCERPKRRVFAGNASNCPKFPSTTVSFQQGFSRTSEDVRPSCPAVGERPANGSRGDAERRRAERPPSECCGRLWRGAARHMRRYRPTTLPRSIVDLKSEARTRMGAIFALAGWKRT